MIVHSAQKVIDCDVPVWLLTGALGEVLRLPAIGPDTSAPLRIGVLGTRTPKKVSAKLRKLAAMLSELRCPIYLIDSRRNGVGGSGSWGPREFATEISALLPKEQRYAFIHLPRVAPSLALLDAYRSASKLPSGGPIDSEKVITAATRAAQGLAFDGAMLRHWQVFSSGYRHELGCEGIWAARAFTEAAHCAGGLAIFLCAESRLDDFDRADQAHQDEHYCHRYTLVRLVAADIQADHPDIGMELTELRIGDAPVVRELV